MEIINEILELFKLLKESSMEPPKIEQITIMYDVLPKELKSIVTYSSSNTAEEFYEEIKDKYSILSYRMDRGEPFYTNLNINRYKNNSIYKNNQSNQEYEDKMDID
ncbi:hypothetical protein BCR36DRAFT_456775, partial [Piromyces finnis]